MSDVIQLSQLSGNELANFFAQKVLYHPTPNIEAIFEVFEELKGDPLAEKMFLIYLVEKFEEVANELAWMQGK